MSQGLFQSLWIPIVLPGQNTIIDASKTVRFRRGKSGKRQIWSKYASLKKTFTNVILGAVSVSSLARTESCNFYYVVSEPSRKRDPSNAAMGSIKIIEDALQVAGVIPNDGWRNVLSIGVEFVHSPEYPGVLVIMSDSRLLPEEALKEYYLQRTQTVVSPPASDIENARSHHGRRRSKPRR